MEKAAAIYERHLVISRFLQETLGVDETLATQDACRIEHIISQETFDKMKAYVKKP